MLKTLSFLLALSAATVLPGCGGAPDRMAAAPAEDPPSTLGYPESHMMVPMISPAFGRIF